MEKSIKTVIIGEEMRDFIQRLWIEYYQQERVVKGLIDDHAYDSDPTLFLESNIFKAYENKCAQSLFAYETATTEMEKMYKPEEFERIDSYKWELDYETCKLTFTQQ